MFFRFQTSMQMFLDTFQMHLGTSICFHFHFDVSFHFIGLAIDPIHYLTPVQGLALRTIDLRLFSSYAFFTRTFTHVKV